MNQTFVVLGQGAATAVRETIVMVTFSLETTERSLWAGFIYVCIRKIQTSLIGWCVVTRVLHRRLQWSYNRASFVKQNKKMYTSGWPTWRSIPPRVLLAASGVLKIELFVLSKRMQSKWKIWPGYLHNKEFYSWMSFKAKWPGPGLKAGYCSVSSFTLQCVFKKTVGLEWFITRACW